MARTTITCTENTWVKVATAVTKCTVHLLDLGGSYLWTYVATGSAAPTNKSNAVFWQPSKIETDQNSLEFGDTAASDVYILCEGKTGKVGVDA